MSTSGSCWIQDIIYIPITIELEQNEAFISNRDAILRVSPRRAKEIIKQLKEHLPKKEKSKKIIKKKAVKKKHKK